MSPMTATNSAASHLHRGKQLLDGITDSKTSEMGSDLTEDQAFENTSTNVAASQMRNALNKLADTVTNPEEKKVSTPVSLQADLYRF